MRSFVFGLIIFIVWLLSGFIMYENHKDDYKIGYTNGYQSRINYEKGIN